MNLRVPRPAGNGYPTSDGKPMAETDWHRRIMLETITTLERHFSDEPMVYVTGNMLLFYAEGDRRRHVSPDVMVFRGVPKGDRPNFLVWQEGKGPDLVVEVTSSSTRREDIGRKMDLYRDVLKVREYVLFDPDGDWLSPRLQGYRLRAGKYVRIRPDDEGRLASQTVGLLFGAQRRRLRLYDPVTAEPLPTESEMADDAEARVAAERARADDALARLAAAEAELARLRGERPQ